MEEISSEIVITSDFDLPRKKPNSVVAFLLLSLSLFLTLHNPQLDLPTKIEPSSIGSPTPPKSPALKANYAVKFVSRSQGVFKLSNGNDDDDLDTPQSKHTATFDTGQKIFKSEPFYQAFVHTHHHRFYTNEIQPRAPPADLT